MILRIRLTYMLIISKKNKIFSIERVELSDEWMTHERKPRVWSIKYGA